jgi:hypothetical protein
MGHLQLPEFGVFFRRRVQDGPLESVEFQERRGPLAPSGFAAGLHQHCVRADLSTTGARRHLSASVAARSLYEFEDALCCFRCGREERRRLQVPRGREDDFGGHAVDISRFLTSPLPSSSSV